MWNHLFVYLHIGHINQILIWCVKYGVFVLQSIKKAHTSNIPTAYSYLGTTPASLSLLAYEYIRLLVSEKDSSSGAARRCLAFGPVEELVFV